MRSKPETPTNLTFGLFFSGIFFLLSIYFWLNNNFLLLFIFITISLIFLLISLVKVEILTPLNIMWYLIGIFLGKIVSPIILCVLFYGLITPYSLVMRLFGRDELRLKEKNIDSYWIKRIDKTSNSKSFYQQF